MPAFIKEQVGWGAGPRASQALILCAKCYAALHGRVNVSCDDVRHLALPVLRHRISCSFAAEAEGITTDAHRPPAARRSSRAEPTANARLTPMRCTSAACLDPANCQRARLRMAAAARLAARLRRKLRRATAATRPVEPTRSPRACRTPTRSATSIPRSWPASASRRCWRRLVVEGFINGLHKSPFHGFSVEFADHREYVPGDDLSTSTGISSPAPTTTTSSGSRKRRTSAATILLDRSASMGFGTGTLTKWDYSCFLATCLAYLMLRQQDAVGLALFGAKPGLLVQPRCRRHAPAAADAGDDRPRRRRATTDVPPSLQAIARKLKRRGLVVVISDLIDDPEATLKSLRLLAQPPARRDRVPRAGRGRAGVSRSRGRRCSSDLETGEELEIDPGRRARRRTWSGCKQLREFYRKGLTESGIDYHLINTRQPYDQALSAYLNRRTQDVATMTLACSRSSHPPRCSDCRCWRFRSSSTCSSRARCGGRRSAACAGCT